MTTAAHSSKRLGAGSPSRSISTEIAHCLSAGRRHFKTYSEDLPRSRPFGDRLVLNLATVQDFERQSVEAVALRRRKIFSRSCVTRCAGCFTEIGQLSQPYHTIATDGVVGPSVVSPDRQVIVVTRFGVKESRQALGELSPAFTLTAWTLARRS
jgi:hypothetical protein